MVVGTTSTATVQVGRKSLDKHKSAGEELCRLDKYKILIRSQRRSTWCIWILFKKIYPSESMRCETGVSNSSNTEADIVVIGRFRRSSPPPGSWR